MTHEEQERMVRRAADDEGARDELANSSQAESIESYYVEHPDERPWNMDDPVPPPSPRWGE